MNIAIIQKLVTILNHQFLIPIQNLNGKYNFYKDLQMNYLEQMEMLCYVEKEFKIDIEDREVDHLLTVNDLVNCIENHIKYGTNNTSNSESGYRLKGSLSYAQLKDTALFI